MSGQASTSSLAVTVQSDLVFAVHDGVKLLGDFYSPQGRTDAPALVAVHGGGWQVGSKDFYRHWGRHLAAAGIAVFSIDYRLGKSGVYPGAVYDTKAAVQFLRANAGRLGIDPARIGLIGDSAGAQLASLVALAGEDYTVLHGDDPHAGVSAAVKAVVAFYGVFDMLAQWNHDLASRPRDSITEKFIGVSPLENRRIYFEASPISYATVSHNHIRFLLIHGTEDDIVDSATQSGAFLNALTQAGYFVRRIILPGAGHFWSSDPFEAEPVSYNALAAPRLLRFLETAL
jgi:acetyl esterase/lipase